jgi:pimeloyl-ACP methyl ester carboxylesterase
MPLRRSVVRHTHVGSPSRLSSLMEARALLEIALLPAALPLLMEVPRGDGHPVLLMPGFMAGESTLIALKLYLQNKGYDVHTWGLGRNVGFRKKHANALQEKIRYLHHITGRKVSLVGWSLGGVFSFYGAESALDCVRSIVTLGSPVSVDTTGVVPTGLAPLRASGAPDAAARQILAGAPPSCHSDQLPVFPDRRRRAAPGGHH